MTHRPHQFRRPDPPPPWPWWSQRAHADLLRLAQTGDLSATGPRHPQIEDCEQLASAALCPGRPMLLCDSGTSALESAYQALQLSRGDEVLVASASFRTTVTAMLTFSLIPVLCDVDPDTAGIDLNDAATRLSERTAALVVTHLWGRPVDLEAVRAFADRHHLALIEDCSHAHGTTWNGIPVGTTADVAIWSCGTTKMVTGGKAGLLTARDPALAERARLLMLPKHRALTGLRDPDLRALADTGVGHNRRPHPMAAVLVADHLHRLPHTLATKNERQHDIEALLAQFLPEVQPLPHPTAWTSGALYKWHWRADPALAPELLQGLRRAGVRAAIPARPLHETPLFQQPELAPLMGLPRLPAADPAGFPGTTRLMAGLVEHDTRDMYEPLPDGDPDPYRAALAHAARHLPTANRG